MIIGLIFIYILIFISPSIVGLILSIVGIKKQINGMNIAGLSLNVVALILHFLKIALITLI